MGPLKNKTKTLLTLPLRKLRILLSTMTNTVATTTRQERHEDNRMGNNAHGCDHTSTPHTLLSSSAACGTSAAAAAAASAVAASPSCCKELPPPRANASMTLMLAADGCDFFFVAALFLYEPRMVPFFTPAPGRRPPRPTMQNAWRARVVRRECCVAKEPTECEARASGSIAKDTSQTYPSNSLALGPLHSTLPSSMLAHTVL